METFGLPELVVAVFVILLVVAVVAIVRSTRRRESPHRPDSR